jgi:hypothetical protein
VSSALESLRGEIASRLSALHAAVPAGVLAGAQKQFDLRIARLERRVLAHAKRRESDALRAVATARAEIAPLGKPQERTLNAVPLWARLGTEWVTALRRACAAHAATLLRGDGEPV